MLALTSGAHAQLPRVRHEVIAGRAHGGGTDDLGGYTTRDADLSDYAFRAQVENTRKNVAMLISEAQTNSLEGKNQGGPSPSILKSIVCAMDLFSAYIGTNYMKNIRNTGIYPQDLSGRSSSADV